MALQAVHSAPGGQLVGSTIRSAPSIARHREDSGNDFVNSNRSVAGRGEHVQPQIRQMDFAVAADHAVRPDQHRGIEQPLAVGLDHAEHGIRSHRAAGSDHRRRRRTRNRLRESCGFLGGTEAVAGRGALREHRQPRPGSRRLAQPLRHPLDVPGDVA